MDSRMADLQKGSGFADRRVRLWTLLPAFREISKYEESVKQYPNLKVGEDFKGYGRR